MRLSMSSLKGADAKDVASSITAIANEKLKLEKDAGRKKGMFIIFCLFDNFTTFCYMVCRLIWDAKEILLLKRLTCYSNNTLKKK